MLATGGSLATREHRLRFALAVQAVGMALLGVVGVGVLIGGTDAGSAFRSAVAPALGIDPLSAFFLAVLALTAVPTLLFARDYLPGSTALAASAR